MSVNKLVISIIFSTSIFSGATFADEINGGKGYLNFKGSVVDAPCNISPDSQNQTIVFDAISTAQLNSDLSARKKFNIELKDCSYDDGGINQANNIKVSFDAKDRTGPENQFLAVKGEATNIGIRIDGFKFGEKTELSDKDMVNASKDNFEFSARLSRIDSNKLATAGDFTADANFKIFYE